MRFFYHYIPAPIILLVIADAIALVLSILLGAALRFSDPDLVREDFLPTAVTFAVIMQMSMATFGLYQREFRGRMREVATRLVASFLVGFALMSFVFYIVPHLYLGRGAFGLSLLAGMIAVWLIRAAFFKWAETGVLLPRVLVLGTGTRALTIATASVPGARTYSANIVGYLPVKSSQHFVDASKILPDEGSPLLSVVDKYRINEIIIAVRERRGGGLPMGDLLNCRLAGVRVTEASTFFERERGQVRLDSLNASWLIFGEGFNNRALRDGVKRAFDLFVSGLLLLIMLPIILLTALLIKLESRGPVFYRQERVGQGGAVFQVCKFRSMRTDAEGDGKPRWASAQDDRVTRVGRTIRKLRIDELPQILNVFNGDMSFVGPRPERPFFVDQLNKEIPYYAARHSIKPGITGWAQVRYPYGASLEDAVEKLQYDLYYVKNHSLFLDLMILVETIQVVVMGKGAR